MVWHLEDYRNCLKDAIAKYISDKWGSLYNLIDYIYFPLDSTEDYLRERYLCLAEQSTHEIINYIKHSIKHFFLEDAVFEEAITKAFNRESINAGYWVTNDSFSGEERESIEYTYKELGHSISGYIPEVHCIIAYNRIKEDILADDFFHLLYEIFHENNWDDENKVQGIKEDLLELNKDDLFGDADVESTDEDYDEGFGELEESKKSMWKYNNLLS